MTRPSNEQMSPTSESARPVTGGLVGLISTTGCPTCGAPLQASGEDPDPYCQCSAGHQFTVERLLDLWSLDENSSIRKYLSVLEISEEWCRQMASRALCMGLSVIAANYHERATLAESRATKIRQALRK